ncbi:uncharacterized protein BJX67DRAFT_352182 [Aspergillus lucknowensis]|uniref:Uncharacterized protein n=1 Tax=Aspergillus lucknowensis TaxID=176173 RepID=A0ABR4LTA0_9EURO
MASTIADPASPAPIPITAHKQKKVHFDVSVAELTDSSDSDSEHVETDPLFDERRRLRRHLGLSEPGEPAPEQPRVQPLFFIERVPDSKAVTCNLPGCTSGVLKPGELRLALNPGMDGDTWFRSSSDYYHISCFESLADFTSPAFLDRIQPLTRNTFKLRGLKTSSVLDGSYLLSGGAERLILEWKILRGMEIDKRDGVYDERVYKLEEGVYELLYRAGSRNYRALGRPGVLDHYEYFTLAKTLAPNESSNGEEWNLFDSFLGNGEGEGFDGAHDLSRMLRRWENAVVRARQNTTDALSGVDGEKALSPTAIKAIRRLSAIPTPQVGFDRLLP